MITWRHWVQTGKGDHRVSNQRRRARKRNVINCRVKSFCKTRTANPLGKIKLRRRPRRHIKEIRSLMDSICHWPDLFWIDHTKTRSQSINRIDQLHWIAVDLHAERERTETVGRFVVYYLNASCRCGVPQMRKQRGTTTTTTTSAQQ